MYLKIDKMKQNTQTVAALIIFLRQGLTLSTLAGLEFAMKTNGLQVTKIHLSASGLELNQCAALPIPPLPTETGSPVAQAGTQLVM